MRSFILPLHRWVGLILGLVFIFIAVTGAGLIFRPQIDKTTDGEMLTVAACTERVPLDTLTANASAAHSEGQPEFVRIFSGEKGVARIPATQIRFTDKDQVSVYLNPCDGTVLGQKARYGGLMGTMEWLHKFKFFKAGSLVTGTSTIILAILLALGGLFLWWPATRRVFKNSWKFNSRLAGRARTLNRHQTIGLYASLIILSSALTGLPQAFDWYKNGLYTLTGSPMAEEAPKSKLPADPQPQLLAMETLWQRTQALTPHPAEALLRFPKPKRSVEIFTVAQDAPNPLARNMIYLDPYTGEVLKFSPYSDSSAGDKLYHWMLSWHEAWVGGLFGQLILLAGALSVPYLAYTGISSYLRKKFRRPTPAGTAHLTVKVTKKTVEAADICTFELADPSGAMLPSFAAGSHIDVHVREGLSRQYSLCNDPKEKHRYLIGVLRDPKSRGGSATMHDEIQEGSLIEISEPKNHFPLAHSAKRSLLMAGGIGITPILCMAERLANVGAEFEMHYCSRSADRTAFVERIKDSAFADRVFFHFDDGLPEQRLDFPALLSNSQPGTHLYVCGPSGFMDFVIATAKQKGWSDDHIHREYFAAPVQQTGSDVAFDVKIASTGKIFRIAKDQTIIAALSASGIDIPTSCEQGVCGTCVTRIIDGEPDHRDVYLTEEERAKNDQFMPCCSRAKSPMLVLDL